MMTLLRIVLNKVLLDHFSDDFGSSSLAVASIIAILMILFVVGRILLRLTKRKTAEKEEEH